MNILMCGERSTLDHLPPREIGEGGGRGQTERQEFLLCFKSKPSLSASAFPATSSPGSESSPGWGSCRREHEEARGFSTIVRLFFALRLFLRMPPSLLLPSCLSPLVEFLPEKFTNRPGCCQGKLWSPFPSQLRVAVSATFTQRGRFCCCGVERKWQAKKGVFIFLQLKSEACYFKCLW